MTVLSVNVNKIAVLRNSRGGTVPDVVQAARVAVGAGCGGITVHPRPDSRHIRTQDVMDLAAWLAQAKPPGVEFNIEGNPFAPPRGEYPGFLALIEAARPAQATLVPDTEGQLTSDHGWDLARDAGRLRPAIAALKAFGCRVSLFMDAGSPGVEQAAAIGADRIELYTGPFAHAFAAGNADAELARCAETARRAKAVGLDVNAGHDLDQRNLGALLRAVPEIVEVSIGHALIAESLYDGLAPTVKRYLQSIAEQRSQR